MGGVDFTSEGLLLPIVVHPSVGQVFPKYGKCTCDVRERLIFQKSYDSGTVPSDWRDAIVPIYKKGDKQQPSNYRRFYRDVLPVL